MLSSLLLFVTLAGMDRHTCAMYAVEVYFSLSVAMAALRLW